MAATGSANTTAPEGLAARQRAYAAARARAAARRRARAVATHLVLIVVAIPFLLPFFWLVTGTFKPSGDLLVVPPIWIPDHWSLDNLKSLFGYSDVNLPFYARNTAYIST